MLRKVAGAAVISSALALSLAPSAQAAENSCGASARAAVEEFNAPLAGLGLGFLIAGGSVLVIRRLTAPKK